MRKLQEHLAYSNIVVAGSAGALALIHSIRFPFIPVSYACMVFFATLSAYGYMHLSGSFGAGTQAEHPVLAYTARHSFLLKILSAASALLALGLLMRFHIQSALWLLPALISSALYPSSKFWRKGLRSFPRLKLPLIAFTWSWVCAFVPLYTAAAPLGLILLRSLLVFFWIGSLAIAFDIRDLQFDDSSIQTSAQRGRTGALRLAQLFNLLAMALLLTEHLLFSSCGSCVLFLVVPGLLTAWGLRRINDRSDPLFISFHMEALPILLAMMIWIAQA